VRQPRARARLGLLGGAALLTLAAAQPSGDQGQNQNEDQGAPKSILPEGMFGTPPALRPAPVAPAPAGTPAAGDEPAAPEGAPTASAGLANPTIDANAPQPGQPGPALTVVNPLDTAAPTADLSAVGLIGPAEDGFVPGVFAGSNGRFLTALMARMTAPIASRWAHIALVRALASTAPPPAGVHPADWIAARVTLLMRLGEGDVAHALAERVSIDRYTPKLYQAAFDASLAAADPAGLCPIALTGQSLSKRVVWRLATAMCAGFAGDDIGAAQGFDNLRSGEADANTVDPFDITLAERLASSAGAGTRTANVEWGEAGTINLYRLGLGVASGAPLPELLLRALPPPASGWLFRTANAADATRAAVALSAGAQGIVGSGELAAFYAALAGDPSSGGVGGDTAAHLRAAYAGSPADRLAAMRALWDANPGAERYGALVLTAGAAINLPPNKRFAAYAPDLMASALAGGRADLAMRWWPIANAEGGRARDLAWAYAAVAGSAEGSVRRLDAWAKAAGSDDAGAADHRARLLTAALTGLGLGGDLGRAYRAAPLADAWTAAIDGAAAAGHAGEVVVLAATGLQAGWADVPPAHLEHIVAALVRVGRVGDARLIAAEAVTRG